MEGKKRHHVTHDMDEEEHFEILRSETARNGPATLC
jgi:hypothetical protein